MSTISGACSTGIVLTTSGSIASPLTINSRVATTPARWAQ
jgi:hypothetical protein